MQQIGTFAGLNQITLWKNCVNSNNYNIQNLASILLKNMFDAFHKVKTS